MPKIIIFIHFPPTGSAARAAAAKYPLFAAAHRRRETPPPPAASGAQASPDWSTGRPACQLRGFPGVTALKVR
ncbi:MAG TPA: hypothetical protein PLP21_08265 [Pyrinomonadaceae bacterium]|nr:hypothetical protein [Acidobacteriota bacterium]HQZ96299.1 hypothetical protein [Pyrinomonadaceae bacterium]